jgi:hypothetical protein
MTLEDYAPSWREEARRDRAARAQLDMQRDAARAELRMAEKRADVEFRREQAKAKADARARARAARSARLSAVTAWLAGHTTDLLLAPVIAVPAVLSWSAMASYGAHLYPAVGYILPAFSEGAMWSFAAATTLSRHRHPERPVWHLRLGTAVFAGFGAVLNFAHGLTLGGPVAGVVMALVSIAGVVAHQLVTVGPRRSRAERDDARIDRAAARRERRARKAALRGTVADMDVRGRARLVYQSGPATLERHFGRTRLVPVAPEDRELPALPAAPVDVPVTAPEADESAHEVPSQDDRLASLADSLERIVAALVTADETANEGAPATVSDTVPEGALEDPAMTEIPAVPETAEDAALAGMKASVLGGKPFTVNGLQTRYRLTRTEAIKLRRLVIPEANGHDVLADVADEN